MRKNHNLRSGVEDDSLGTVSNELGLLLIQRDATNKIHELIHAISQGFHMHMKPLIR